MRSNGLTAPAYTPVADLDPVLATALLDDLKHQGVAAYTKPVESTTTSGFDRPEFRVGVRDRLYVDAAAFAQVRDLLRERDPDLLDDNEDLTWAQLVAGFDQPLSTDDVPWPAVEDLAPADSDADSNVDGTTAAATATDEAGPPVLRTRPDAGTQRRQPPDAADGSDVDAVADNEAANRRGSFDDADFLASTSTTKAAPDDDEDRFVPDPPPPLPYLAPHRLAGWIGVVGGPLLLLIVAIFGYSPPGWLAFLGVVGFVGGFISLVVTMGDGDDDDWGPDNGAVV